MKTLADLRVKIFADGADRAGMLSLYAKPFIQGFTTNPTLMRKAGVSDYETFTRQLLECVPDRPVSIEVFADDFADMVRQARIIASWGPNAVVKVPVTNTRREFAGPVIRELSEAVRARRVSPVALAETFLDRLERVCNTCPPSDGIWLSFRDTSAGRPGQDCTQRQSRALSRTGPATPTTRPQLLVTRAGSG